MKTADLSIKQILVMGREEYMRQRMEKIKKADLEWKKLPVNKKIHNIKQQIQEKSLFIKTCENKYRISSEEILKKEPVEFDNTEEIDNWVTSVHSLYNLKKYLRKLMYEKKIRNFS